MKYYVCTEFGTYEASLMDGLYSDAYPTPFPGRMLGYFVSVREGWRGYCRRTRMAFTCSSRDVADAMVRA